jgi:hypothetical protein
MGKNTMKLQPLQESVNRNFNKRADALLGQVLDITHMSLLALFSVQYVG